MGQKLSDLAKNENALGMLSNPARQQRAFKGKEVFSNFHSVHQAKVKQQKDLALIDDLKDKYSKCTNKFEIITPEKANQYLKKTLHFNREVGNGIVNRYSRLMKEGRWRLNADAIAFDWQGRLINGQHRLRAIIKSQTIQPFYVARGMDIDSAAILDQGKGRSQTDRIGMKQGEQLNKCGLRVAKMLLTNWSLGSTGLIKFNEQYHDKLVFDFYLKYRNIIDTIVKDHKQRQTLIATGAARILIEDLLYMNTTGKTKSYKHSQTIFERAEMFYTVANEGVNGKFDIVVNTDWAIIELNRLIQKRKLGNQTWSGIQCYRDTLSFAWCFLNEFNKKETQEYMKTMENNENKCLFSPLFDHKKLVFLEESKWDENITCSNKSTID
tara:strand:- start:47 stop:1192 length:1146 start_codon:yes stop_codon:yes gene_type:complete